MKRGKEIKRDIEMAMVGFNQAIVNGNTSTARKMASLSKQITTAHPVRYSVLAHRWL